MVQSQMSVPAVALVVCSNTRLKHVCPAEVRCYLSEHLFVVANGASEGV